LLRFEAADLSTEQRAALQTDFDALRAQVDQVANSATFNGLNLVAAGGSNLGVVMSDIAGATTGRQIASTVIAGVVPGLSAYVVGNGSVVAADDSTFNLNGVAIGTVDVTASMTIQGYLDQVSTQTGGRVTASYNQSTGQFSYVAAEAVAGSNELTITTAGTARSWLGQGVAAGAVSGGAVTSTITNRDFTVGGAGALSTVSTAANLLAITSRAFSRPASSPAFSRPVFPGPDPSPRPDRARAAGRPRAKPQVASMAASRLGRETLASPIVTMARPLGPRFGRPIATTVLMCTHVHYSSAVGLSSIQPSDCSRPQKTGQGAVRPVNNCLFQRGEQRFRFRL
jgi:flagellin-like hook-associated protein FlgL